MSQKEPFLFLTDSSRSTSARFIQDAGFSKQPLWVVAEIGEKMVVDFDGR